ncbi:pimeloyl-ACP methyl ester carboxylesterase [Prescottella agglutinans]|uniref:Pimeloyl-ACP methyl ester carboxylesterase n=1 Tax=Prescottella agglutinans TaxID=1644129 RepID=A0ABT6M5Y6_9NOCA|nr:pimeloyl-ACP methyl ester carboxylesterase [Prescottella agglutinans]
MLARVTVVDVLNSGNSIRKLQSRTGRSARLGAVAIGLTVGFASAAVPSAAADPSSGELAWGPCPAEYSLDPDTDQCGTVTVPRDYANPGAGSIDVLVTRHRAEDPAARRGVLFTNPGGPGGDAIASNGMIAQALPEQIRRQWDFIGVQPRGLAHAGAVECAVTPELLAAMNVGFSGGAARLACDGAAPGATAHITTENTARDWEQVRIALGADVIDVYGLSYGTILASTYATLFPQHTGRMVLDSAVDRDWLWNDVLWRQNDGYKARFYDLMDWIAANDATYGLGDTPLKVYQRWSDRVVEEAGGNPTLAPPPARIGDVPPGLENIADAYRAGVDLTGPARVQFEAFVRRLADPAHTQSASSIYALTRQTLPARNSWPMVARVIRDGLGALPAAPPGDVSEDQLDSIVQAQMMQALVLCNENAVAPRPERLPGWLFSTFVTGDLFDAIGYGYSAGAGCAGAPPVTALPEIGNHGLATAPLVLQGLRDPQTPYDGGIRHARDMDAHLVTVEGGDHGAAIQGGNTTVDTAITDYLLTGATTITRAPEAPITAPL